MSKRIKTIPATSIVAHGEGWWIEYDRFSRDFAACIENGMDVLTIAFKRTQGEAQAAIDTYRYEELSQVAA